MTSALYRLNRYQYPSLHWGSNLLHLVHCTHCQSFQRLSRFDVACVAQRPCHDRSWTKQVTFSHYRLSFCLRGKASSSSLSTGAWAEKRPWRSAPLLHSLIFLSTNTRASNSCYLLCRPAAMNPQVIQIQSDLPIFWFSAGCCHG